MTQPTPQNSPSEASSEQLWVKFVSHITTVHAINSSPFEYNQCGCVTKFQDDSTARLLLEAQEYQTGISLCNEKLGIWGLSIARQGKTVFGDIYKSEQEAKDAIPSVITALKAQLTPKEPTQPPKLREDK